MYPNKIEVGAVTGGDDPGEPIHITRSVTRKQQETLEGETKSLRDDEYVLVNVERKDKEEKEEKQKRRMEKVEKMNNILQNSTR